MPKFHSQRRRPVAAKMPTAPVILLDSFPNLLEPAQSPYELGRLGEYRVLKTLGQGGRGVVFLAEDAQLGRTVALKIMRPELAAEAKAHARFLREAQAMAQVKNEHIVPIHQVGEIRGVPYLAMEHLHGMTLESWLDRGKSLTYVQIARTGREAAQGLAAAHKHGLIHRDIKPDNIWLEKPKGHVKLLDFGMARPVDTNVNITDKGDIVGTPAYMSPEQTRDLPLDGRTDLFSLGVVLYRLCSGRLPFDSPNPLALMAAIALERPPALAKLKPDVPPALARLIMQMLAKRADDRPASAQLVADELLALERGLLFGDGMPSGRTMIAVTDQKTSMKVGSEDTVTPADLLKEVRRRNRLLMRALLLLGGISMLLGMACALLLIRMMG